MKTLTILFLAIALAFSNALALTQMGNGALLLEGRLDAVYDSNIFIRKNNDVDDFLGILYGGLAFVQEDRSVLNATLRMGVEATRFMDFSEEDAEDFKSSFSISYPNNIQRPGYFEFSGSFNEDTVANDDVGQRIELDRFDISTLYRHQVSNRIQVEGDIGFNDVSYSSIIDPETGDTFSRDSDIVSVGVLGGYAYSERLYGILRVQYRELDSQGNNTLQQDSMVYAVGLRGELGPTLSGGISFGTQSFDLARPNGDISSSDFFYSVDLVWNPRAKTQVTIAGDTQFVTSALGDVNNRESISLSVSERLSEKISLNGGIVFAKDNYQGFFNRKAEVTILSAGALYTLTPRTFINLRLSYTDRSISDFAAGDYSRYIGRLGISTVW